MQTKNILSVAAAVASFATAAFAGTPAKVVAPAPAPAPAASPISGTVFAGYATNYTCRGIVASHSLVEGDSVIPVGVDAKYAVNETNSVLASATYTSLCSGHHMFGERTAAFHNETDIKLGWENTSLAKGLTVSGGWNLIHGGLLGSIARYGSHAGRELAHSVTQEFFATANYDINENVFVGTSVSYAFQGNTGWWFMPYVGYKTPVCSMVDVIGTVGMSATAGYYNKNAINIANGSQAFWIKGEAQIKTGVKNLTVVPFVSLNWLGDGALKVNRGVDKGSKAFKNFGVVAGANVVYSF